MKKSDSSNGITIEKNIELVMSSTGNVGVGYYIAQLILLMIVCSSICYCLITGIGIEEISSVKTIGVIIIFCILFFIIFLAKSMYKVTLPVIVFLYVIIGYIGQEILTEGFAHLANPVIKLYNNYFQARMGLLQMNNPYSTKELEFLIAFLMFFIVAVTVYTVIHSRSIICYLIVTIPLVFLSFIVGQVPGILPYMIYVIGTITIFISVISEKYGMFTKISKQHMRNGQWFYPLEKTRVKLQVLSFSILFILGIVLYGMYSPNWYEEEFDVKQIRSNIQTTMREITSGEYFKDSPFSDMFKKKGNHSNSGLSNGKLGTVGNLRYANKTALRVTTTSSNDGSPCYLKGFVGEVYTSNQWKALSKEEQQQLKELEQRLLSTGSVENLPSKYFQIIRNSPYQVYDYAVKTIDIENVSADNSVDYVPYLLQQSQLLTDGKISSSGGTYTFYSFNPQYYDNNLPALNSVYKNVSAITALQMNYINEKVLENYMGFTIDSGWQYNLDFEDRESIYQTVGLMDTYLMTSNKSQVSNGNTFLPDSLSLFTNNTQLTLLEMINTVAVMKEYEQDEREYYQLVMDLYTKLPESELDKIQNIVKDHKVDVNDQVVIDPTYIEDYDGTSYLEQIYSGNTIGDNLYSIDFMNAGDEYIQRQYYNAVEFVQDYLSRNASYTLDPGITPSGKDFVEYFLFENKKGYCMHFASSAVVMLRAMGVPCRYVEGYLITNKDYANATNISTEEVTYYGFTEYTATTNVVEIDVKDTNAHAWVEVYMPGLGWMPFEVTGSYTINNEIQVPPVNQDPNATLIPTEKPSSTPAPTQTLRPFNTAKPSTSPTVKPTTSVKPSTKPSIGPGGSSGGGNVFANISTWYKNLPKWVHRMINVMLSLLILLITVISILLIRRIILLRNREKQLIKASSNKQVLLYYRGLERLLRKRGILYTSNDPYASYVQEIVSQYPFLLEEEVSRAMNLVLKAKFQEELISIQELTELKRFYQFFINNVYSSSNKWKRVYYRYIFVLE